MPAILIMTDSTCDLPAEWVKQQDIRVVPTYLHFGLESLADDGVQLKRATFYQRLASSAKLPTTAAPPTGEIIEVMAQALQDADHVVALTAPAKLSGIYNGFRLAAEQTNVRRVTLIDSQMTSMGLGWQVLTAAEMAQSGAGPAEIEAAVLAMQPRSEVWAALDTMDNLRRSGRVSWAAAKFGGLFQIKPLIRLHESEISPVTRVRTSQRAFEALVELARKAAPLERLAILHTSNLNRAKLLAETLADLIPGVEYPIVDVTPVLGVHVGQNGLGLAVVRREL
jgi:DegV family protein with EDD domain